MDCVGCGLPLRSFGERVLRRFLVLTRRQPTKKALFKGLLLGIKFLFSTSAKQKTFLNNKD